MKVSSRLVAKLYGARYRIHIESTGSSVTDVNLPPNAVESFRKRLEALQSTKLRGNDPGQIEVLYLDEHLIIVNKSNGVLTVPGIHQKESLLSRIHVGYGGNDVRSDHMIVHRLDMDTSGIVVFGRRLDVTKKLQKLFRERRVSKEYQAIVAGHFPIDEGSIDVPLSRDHKTYPYMRIGIPVSELESRRTVELLNEAGLSKFKFEPAKKSLTEFQVLERFSTNEIPLTRMLLKPLTGRRHQLRVHCAACGFPIIGDPVYRKSFEDVEDLRNEDQHISSMESGLYTSRMCLHASKLEFVHPETDSMVSVTSEPNFAVDASSAESKWQNITS